MYAVTIALLIGILLGQFYSVMALAPAFMLTLILAIGAGLARADAASSITSAFVAIFGIQMGYLLGGQIALVRAKWVGTKALRSLRRSVLPDA